MKYCNYCNKEVKSKGEIGCYSECGRDCNDCCSQCNRHGLTQGVIAVVEGKLTSPSYGLRMIADDVRRGMREVDRGDKSEFICQIEDGSIYQSSVKVSYSVYFRYVKGQNYTVYTSYRK